ncbi:MAG: hypothetical protein GX802_06245 [Clostridiales bacterium]|nr:hypothetical protein [Clostridiales bacterium]
MKKTIKIIALLLAFGMLMMLFSACAKKKDELEGAGDINDEDMTGGSNTQAPANTNQSNDIPQNEFTSLMPEVDAMVKGVMNNDFGTTVIYDAVTEAEFAQIVQAAKNKGFTVEATEGELQYLAQNESGMFIQVLVMDDALRVSVYSNAAHLN